MNRHAWAVDLLTLRPGSRVLEIGCGGGAASELALARLARGTLVAIDRSPKMIALAAKRNAAAVDEGRAVLRALALADAGELGEQFDEVFAINVNVFWLGASAELGVLRTLMRPRATLHLVYELPSATKVKATVARIGAELEANGFEVRDVRTDGARCAVKGRLARRQGRRRRGTAKRSRRSSSADR